MEGYEIEFIVIVYNVESRNVIWLVFLNQNNLSLLFLARFITKSSADV